MDMMSYSKKYSRLLLWGIFSFLVLTGNLLSVIGYSSLINISPVFKLGIGVILLFFCFFIYVHKMTIPNPEKHIFIVIAIMLYVNMKHQGRNIKLLIIFQLLYFRYVYLVFSLCFRINVCRWKFDIL